MVLEKYYLSGSQLELREKRVAMHPVLKAAQWLTR